MLKYYADTLSAPGMILVVYKPFFPPLRCVSRYNVTIVEGSVCFTRTLQSSMICAEENS